MLRLLLPLALALAAFAHAFPAERPISDARIGIAAPSAWRRMMGAPGDGRFLVTWPSIGRGGQAALFDGAGARIGDASIALPLSPEAIVWRGDSWTIVGFHLGGRGYVRVDRDGVLLDPVVQPLDVTGSIEGAVWTGTSLLIAYWRSAPREFGVAVFDANLSPAARHVIGTDINAVFLSTDGETALLGHLDQVYRQAPLRTVLFGADGALMRTKDVEDGGRPLAIGSRGGGQGYVVIVQTAEEWEAVFQGFHLDHELTKRTVPAGFGRSTSIYEYGDTLSWDGSAFHFFYAVAGDDTAVVRASRISEHGALLDDGMALSFDGTMRSDTGIAGVSGMGTTLLLFLRGESSAASDHFLRVRTGPDAAALLSSEEVELERGAFEQRDPVAASNAAQSLVAWRERVSATAPHWVFATRVDANGNVRDPQSLLLGTSSCAGTPGIATSGDGFLVTWYDEAGAMMAHVAADGTVSPATRLQRFREDVCPAGAPSVASNGADYLVVWRRKGETRDAQLGVRVRGDGTLVDTVPIDLGATFGGYAIASDGTDYLLAAEGRYMRVAANGTPLDPRIGAFSGRRAHGDATMMMWWNGRSYSLLQQDGGEYQWVRVAADGSVTKAGEPFAWPLHWSMPRWGSSSFACRGSSCEGLAGTIEDGRYLLRQFDARDDGSSAPSFGLGEASPVAPVLLREPFEAMRLVPFGVPGGRRFVAFTRYALEAPHSGISRIFLRAEEPPVRTRTVRH